MANRDRPISHGDLFDEEPRDATLLGDVERCRILLQAVPEGGQDVLKLERGQLVHDHGFQGQDFFLDGLDSCLQCRPAVSQLFERLNPS
jgi:hypothetical protein